MTHSRNTPRSRRGAAAVLAMLFVLVATTLVVGMYSTTQLNVQSSKNAVDADRALSAAESGMNYFTWRLKQVSRPRTTSGTVTAAVVDTLWPTLVSTLTTDLTGMTRSTERPVTTTGTSLTTSSISLGDASFAVTIQRHPIGTGDPYDGRYVQITSTGTANGFSRTVTSTYQITKTIPYAIVGRTRIQVGRNTLINGAMGMATATKTPPYLMLSDFEHLDPTLTTQVTNWYTWLEQHQTNAFDNRVEVTSSVGAAAISAGYTDYNADGYIDDYDLFVKRFDKNNDKAISKSEFTNPSTGKLYDDNLFTAIDTLDAPRYTGDTARSGYNDGVISNADNYAKARGQVSMAVTQAAWTTDLATGGQTIYDVLQGPIAASRGIAPVKFNDTAIFDLSPANFEQATINFKARSGTSAGTASRTSTVIQNTTLASTDANGTAVTERTPYGSTTYQATFKRPVFKNLTLKNVIIPKGMNALFDNCVFQGVTFVDTQRDITDSSSNVTTDPDDGMTWAQKKVSGGTFTKDQVLLSSGTPTSSQTITQGSKNGNNVRFNNCTFNGPIAGAYATAYTHFANSWEFTGSTLFDNQVDATATIVSPQVNIEMGSFTDPTLAPSTLVGVVVAGNIDIRGTSVVDGSIIVTGDGAGNTTLGYFGPSDGDTNPSAMPEGGYGRLSVRYNPYRTLPDGINIPVDLTATPNTYKEVRP